MAASHYYQDHPYNRPGPTYPPGAPPVNPASDSPSGVDAHHPRRRRDETRSYSAPRRSRRSDHRPSRGDEYPRGRRHGDRDDYQRSYSSSSPSRSPPPKPRRRKSLGEQAMAALGLGSFNSHESGHRRTRSRDRDHYDTRNHRDYDSDRRRRGRRHRSRSYSRSPSPSRASKDIKSVITAALTAGAAEAYRARKEPGGWTGEKGKRVLTAAISARGVDKFIERDRSRHTKRNILESTLASLATTHLMKDGRARSRSRHGRRVRSDSRGGINSLDATGVLAAAGKKAYEHYRSRDKSLNSGYSSDESDQPHRRRRKKRSQSMSDYVAKGLAALGLADDVDDKRHSKRRHGRDRGSSDNDEYSDEYPQRRHERRSRRSR